MGKYLEPRKREKMAMAAIELALRENERRLSRRSCALARKIMKEILREKKPVLKFVLQLEGTSF